MSSHDIRKNFVFKKEIAQHLEAIAKKENKSMTKVIEELVEKKHKEVSKEEKLKALQGFFKATHGMFESGMTIQSIKANKDV
jgi:methionine salvage enolase-phosphatase E1